MLEVVPHETPWVQDRSLECLKLVMGQAIGSGWWGRISCFVARGRRVMMMLMLLLLLLSLLSLLLLLLFMQQGFAESLLKQTSVCALRAGLTKLLELAAAEASQFSSWVTDFLAK